MARAAQGYIKQSSKGVWKIKLSWKDSASGEYLQKWFTFRGGSKEADNYFSDLKRQYLTGAMVKPSKLTVAEYLLSWINDYRPNLTPRSLERYDSIIKRKVIPALGNIKLTDLKPGHLQHHYSELVKSGLSPRTARYSHTVLHRALAMAVSPLGLLSRNPADGIMIPKAHPAEMQIWDSFEMGKFLDAAKGSPYYALFFTALFTGMRRSEILALRWQDIDFILSQIYVNRGAHMLKDNSIIFTNPKTAKSRRVVAMSPALYGVLEAYRRAREHEHKLLNIPLLDDALVFSFLGKPMRPNTVSRSWHDIAVKAGVKPIRFHDGRHTHASLLLKQGIHPKIVQERLGHSSISVTLDIYSHVAPGIQEAAALKFDDIAGIKDNSKAVQERI